MQIYNDLHIDVATVCLTLNVPLNFLLELPQRLEIIIAVL